MTTCREHGALTMKHNEAEQRVGFGARTDPNPVAAGDRPAPGSTNTGRRFRVAQLPRGCVRLLTSPDLGALGTVCRLDPWKLCTVLELAILFASNSHDVRSAACACPTRPGCSPLPCLPIPRVPTPPQLCTPTCSRILYCVNHTSPSLIPLAFSCCISFM